MKEKVFEIDEHKYQYGLARIRVPNWVNQAGALIHGDLEKVAGSVFTWVNRELDCLNELTQDGVDVSDLFHLTHSEFMDQIRRISNNGQN